MKTLLAAAFLAIAALPALAQDAPAPAFDPNGSAHPDGTDGGKYPPPAVAKDWRWVKGAIFVPTNCVNEAQMWDEYNPEIVDRELHYDSVYGFNCVTAYLHYLVYVKKKEALLAHIEDFLTRADKYGIKVNFVFFDSCWNDPAADLVSSGYAYPAPLYGVHNSRWLKGPGDAILKDYDKNKARLQAYVQDVVHAHKDDPRIAFWQTYNEPDKDSKEVARLMADSLKWIHATGSTLPVTATGGSFPGDAYSDFRTWHEYGGAYNIQRETVTSLCTECMHRTDQSIPGIVSHFAGKVGFIVWEAGIGRDNCRFAWGQNRDHPAQAENDAPFHGMIYPDGHPWSVDDAKALLGVEGFAKAPLFKVAYFSDPAFTTKAKESVTPLIDFDLNGEKGTNIPDSSLKNFPASNWSVRWTGTIAAPQAGSYTFTVDGDNEVKVLIGGKTIVEKNGTGRSTATGEATLAAGTPVEIQVDYVHADGLSRLHLDWEGPGVAKQALAPVAGK